MTKFGFLWIMILIAFVSCKGKTGGASGGAADSTAGTSAGDAGAASSSASEDVKTPVTTASVSFGDITDSIELNATATFLQNNFVRSTATGYVKTVTIHPGEQVGKGQVLFSIETKESTVIGNSISRLDSSFKFTGVNTVRSPLAGYVMQLNHQPGDYVQDGEQLAVISDINSFVFLLNLPYELRPFVLNKKSVDLVLPDGVALKGVISAIMPTVDSAAQTQSVVIRVSSAKPIPQNVIARVRIVKSDRPHAQTVPKTAILSDESQTSFWVMKLIDSATAVKVPVKKGIEQTNSIEILDPVFSSSDRIVVTGNYGLPDTAKVIVEKP